MRRNARALILILLLVVGAGLLLGFQTINLGGFQRGGDTFLGLSLGLDLQGGSHLVYRAEPIAEDGGEPQPPNADDMESLKRIIERRVNSSGLGEPIIQILGEDRLLIQLPGVADPERAEAIIGETAQLEFKHRRVSPPRNLATEGIITDEDVVSVSAQQLPEELLPESDTESGEASESTENADLESPVIIVEFTEEGAAKFDQVHANLLQEFSIAAATANIFTYQSQLQAAALAAGKRAYGLARLFVAEGHAQQKIDGAGFAAVLHVANQIQGRAVQPGVQSLMLLRVVSDTNAGPQLDITSQRFQLAQN